MKHIFTLALAFMMTGAFAQTTVTENFESFVANSPITTQDLNDAWRTWSTAAYDAREDANVKNVELPAGAPKSKTLYLKSTSSSGGPTDVVYEFPENYNSGIVTTEFDVFIVAGTGGYWGYKADKSITGDANWETCLDVEYSIDADGKVFMYLWSDVNKPAEAYLVETSDAMGGNNGKWVKTKLVANLNSNTWTYYFAGQQVATFFSYHNQLGCINFYPLNDDLAGEITRSEYYVDNIEVTHEPRKNVDYNGLVYRVEPISGIEGLEVPVTSTLRNIGNKTMTSFDITVKYQGAVVHTETISGVSVPSLGFYDYTSNKNIALKVGTTDNLSVEISNINGNTDEDPSDNIKTIKPFVKYLPEGKKLLLEYTTSTANSMSLALYKYADLLTERFGDNLIDIQIQTRKSDDKTVLEYRDAFAQEVEYMGTIPVNKLYVNRGVGKSGNEKINIYKNLEYELTKNVSAYFPLDIQEVSSTYNTTEISVDITVKFNQPMTIEDTVNVGCMIRQTEMINTTSRQYNQANYWQGYDWAMFGFGDLADPVPAKDMVYKNVARGFFNGLHGERIEGDANYEFNTGDTYTITLTTPINPVWDLSKIELVPVAFEAEFEADFQEMWYWMLDCELNKLGTVTNPSDPTGVSPKTMAQVQVYPNPANNVVNISGVDVEVVNIYNTQGKKVRCNRMNETTIDISGLTPGMYLLTGKTRDGQLFSTKLIKE